MANKKVKKGLQLYEQIMHPDKYRYVVRLYRNGFGHVDDVYFKRLRIASLYASLTLRFTTCTGYVLENRVTKEIIMDVRTHCRKELQ